jgi:hypothetical protein
MENQKKTINEYYEILTLNAQKGETYILKLKNDSVVYLTIPMIHPTSDTGVGGYFTFKVIKPDLFKGMYRGSLSEIDILKRT